jgi:hypothetical protein
VLCARSGDRFALHGVKLIAPLFQVERESRDAGDNAAQRWARRQEKSASIIAAVVACVDAQRAIVPPKTELGSALGYIHRTARASYFCFSRMEHPLTNNRRDGDPSLCIHGFEASDLPDRAPRAGVRAPAALAHRGGQRP